MTSKVIHLTVIAVWLSTMATLFLTLVNIYTFFSIRVQWHAWQYLSYEYADEEADY